MKEIDLDKLFEIAGERAPELEGELNGLAKLLAKNFELRVFFENGGIDGAAKLKLLKEIKPKSSAIFLQLFELLVKEDLEKRFIKVSERFTKLVAKQTGTTFAEVKTAYPLTEADNKTIVKWVGGKVLVRQEVDPALIGGISVRTSDGKYFDGSLRGALANLKENIINV